MNDSSHEAADDSRMQAIDLIIDEITARIRRGESPELAEYQTRYPDYSTEIEDLWSALVMVGNLGPGLLSTDIDRTRANTTQHSLPFQRLGDFEIIREIGRGGMGVVYAARQISLDRLVAIKILNQSILSDAQYAARFRREALSAARLQHAHIVPVFGNGEEQGVSYYSMQLIDGVSLSAVLDELRRWSSRNYIDAQNSTESLHSEIIKQLMSKDLNCSSSSTSQANKSSTSAKFSSSKMRSVSRSSRSSASESTGFGRNYFMNVAKVARQVAEALRYAHDHQTIHRDIKPSNLIIDRSGAIWVTDFGLAKFDSGPDLTQEGDVIGTLKYMAPEQLSGQCAPCCDIYSLGATLYELITLRQPIIANDKIQIFDQIRNREPIRPRDIDSRIPSDLETITLKAMAKLPSDRYATAQEFADDLGRFIAGDPIFARPFSRAERIWRWCLRNSIVASLSASLILVFLGVFVATWGLWLQAEARAKAETNLRKRAEDAESSAKQMAMDEAQARKQTERALYRSNIVQAQLEWRAHNVSGTQQILAECNPALRGWEWYYLKQLCESELITLRGHSNWVHEVTCSSDDRWIASVGGGNPFWKFQGAESIKPGEICLWNAEDGAIVHRIQGHTNLIHCVAFNPDGTLLATAGADQDIKLWDPVSGSLVKTLKGNSSTVRSLAFHPDGHQIASGSEDHLIKLWDLESGQVSKELAGHQAWVRRVVYAPDGNTLYSASTLREDGMGEVMKWDLTSNEPGGVLESGDNGPYLDLAIDREGKLLAAACDIGIKVWDLSTGKLAHVLSGHRGIVQGVSFSPDGLSIVSGGNDTTVRIWNLKDSKDPILLQAHLGVVRRVVFSNNGERVISCSDDETVKVWNAQAHPEYASVDVPGLNIDMADVDAIAFTEDGSAVVTARGGWSGEQGTGLIYDAHDFTPLSKARIGVSGTWMTPACKMSMDAHGERLVGISLQDRRVAKLWNARTGQELKSFPAHRGNLWHVTLSPDGKYLATASWFRLLDEPTCDVKIFDVDSEKPLLEFSESNCRVTRFAFSSHPSQPLLAIATLRELRNDQGELESRASNIRLLDLTSGRERKSINGDSDSIGAINFDSQANFIAAAGTDLGTLILHDIQNDRTVRTTSSPNAAMDLTFTPDGRRIVVAGRLMVKILDANDGQELLILRSSRQAKMNTSGFNPRVRVSSDGMKIVAICHDSDESMSLWSIDETEPEQDISMASNTAEAPVAQSDIPALTNIAKAKLSRARRLSFASHIRSCRTLELPEDLNRLQFHCSQLAKYQSINAWQLLYRSSVQFAAGNRDLAEQDWKQAIAINPKNSQLWESRMMILMECGDWPAAYECLNQCPELADLDSPSDISIRALLHLFSGNESEYRAGCKTLFDKYGSATDPATVMQLLSVGLVSPNSGIDTTHLTQIIPKTNYQSQDDVTRYSYFLKILAAYRSGQYSLAQEYIKENEFLDSSAGYRMMDWIVLAMMEANEGEISKAEKWLRQARENMDLIEKEASFPLTSSARISAAKRLCLELLFREATKMTEARE